MSDFDFRFVFRDRLAVLADPDDERTPGALDDLRFTGRYSPSESLTACKGLVAALAALHEGASAGDMLAADPSGEPIDNPTMLTFAANLDGLRAEAWHARDWEVFALAYHLQDALERRVRPVDHEVVDFGGDQ